jgi:hypothetical protein
MTAASPNLHTASRLGWLVCAAGLVGCAVTPSAPTVLVLPGVQKSTPQFQADSAACQQQAQAFVAPQVDAANNQAATNAVVGTAIGAAVGALLGSGYHYNNSSAAWGAGTGLLVGSSMGAGQSQVASYSLQQRYDIAFMQCMYQLGNRVPGQEVKRRPVQGVRTVPAVPPANAPVPNYPPANTPAPNFPPPNTLPPIGVLPPA